MLGWLKQHGQRPKRLLFVSSSSVYEQKDGEWIDETAPAEANAYSGRLMLEAEQVALDSGIPASRVRLTGIYGPGREWLLTQVRRGTEWRSSRRFTAIASMPMMLPACWPACSRPITVGLSWRTAT